MSDLLDHVEQSIRARRLFRPGQSILVAVSGGVDSMVLLHVLRKLAGKHHWRLAAAHFNHRLRGRSSDADERLVRRTVERLKVPLRVAGADVRAFARTQKLSLEMAARKLRHGFLARAAAKGRIPSVALAHHADDQLELFFLRLLRGSGGEGLAGMKWRNPSPFDPELALVHPLLDQPKSALLAYAAEQGIEYREDVSNAALDFQRNRVRHELLPLLRRKYQPALDRTIARVMEILGAEAEFATEAARDWLQQLRKAQNRGRSIADGGWHETRRNASRAKPVRLSTLNPQPSTPFDQLPLAVQRRCVQLQLLELDVVPDFELVEQLRTVADRPVSVCQLQGLVPLCAVRDRAGVVRLQPARAEAFKSSAVNVTLKGGAGGVKFGGATISWRVEAPKTVRPPRARAGRESFDADEVGAIVRLRHWRPGDRYQPIGMAGPVKLQDWLTNQKVARDRRRQLVVAATTGGEVFWVEGMRISERFKLTERTTRCLQWHWKRR